MKNTGKSLQFMISVKWLNHLNLFLKQIKKKNFENSRTTSNNNAFDLRSNSVIQISLPYFAVKTFYSQTTKIDVFWNSKKVFNFVSIEQKKKPNQKKLIQNENII